MALRRRIGSALGAAAALAGAGVVAGAGVTAGLVGGTAGLVEGAARASLSRAHSAAVSGTRAVGTLLTGADPLPDGHLHDLLDAARGMVEPPPTRHTRRVWADRGRAQVELLVPDAQEAPEVRSALRRHLERLEGVEWATVNDVVGRVLVAFDERQVTVEDLVGTVTAIEKARGGQGLFPAPGDHPAHIQPSPSRCWSPRRGSSGSCTGGWARPAPNWRSPASAPCCTRSPRAPRCPRSTPPPRSRRSWRCAPTGRCGGAASGGCAARSPMTGS